ncbi:autotransporter outer membrane beta-barrel domain-containing protein [Pseudomonas akapageensis]|uniref:autotransporter outer membrane beta-barrel domain-containing protein n=1 Tax=Pseudomonas akapageensis TaxID=2609961 RepID=UPI00140BC5AF|nr:autotransporter outer membrane beta-barrel domain-containing protein [Pseudomonas akapageensis]
MTVGRFYPLHPLTRALKWVALAPAIFLSPSVLALTTVVGDKVIDATAPLDNYRVTSGSSLTGNGASMRDIRLDSGAKLTLNGSAVASDRQGLYMGRVGAIGSVANVNDSSISGTAGGALVSTNSELHLQRSQLTGTGSTSAGIDLFGGTVNAVSSSIVGGQNGVRILGDRSLAGVANLTLDGTQVVGKDGAAIAVGALVPDPATAQITVGNGSTLHGSNGNLLEVSNGSTANLQVDNSHLVGDVVVESGSTANLTLQNQATLTGRLDNVASLTLNSQGQWNMVGDASVANLAMDGGAVKFGEANAFHTLSVENLSGNGTFIMGADFSSGQTDHLEVTGSASGNHALLVSSSGADPVAESQLHVVHTAGGDANFALLGGEVDLGTYSYDLVRDGNDWYLDASRKVISPGTQSVLALFNTAQTVWYGELTSLRSRMGELRLDDGKAGGWIRAYGNKYNVSASSGLAYDQVQRGFSLGADAPLAIGDGQWLVGVLAGHSKSDLDIARGTSGEVNSYYLGAYTTWLDAQSGYYVDGVVKFNRFDNESKVSLSDGQRTKGDYDNHGIGASVEVGRHIKLKDDYFLEPFTQWSVVDIQGSDYTLDNGMRAEGDRTRSLLGKVGSTAGRNFDLGEGRVIQPYVRLAYVHEFAKNNEVQVNDNVFNNDLSGSRGEVGAGVAVSLMERLQLHADFDYSNGEKIEQPWGANVGLRYSW